MNHALTSERSAFLLLSMIRLLLGLLLLGVGMGLFYYGWTYHVTDAGFVVPLFFCPSGLISALVGLLLGTWGIAAMRSKDR